MVRGIWAAWSPRQLRDGCALSPAPEWASVQLSGRDKAPLSGCHLSHPLQWRKDRRISGFKVPPNLNQVARIGASQALIFGIRLEPGN